MQAELQPMLDKLKSLADAAGVNVSESDAEDPLPPASLQRVLRHTGNDSLPSLVLTDHRRQFTNK